MTAFDLRRSLEKAEKRLGDATTVGRPRGDRGRSRLPSEVRAKLEELLQGQERLPVRELMARLARHCEARGLRRPARATIYQAMASTPLLSYPVADLPAVARQALYNLQGTRQVPGHQLAFYCFNYGDLGAISFAAGLPWLALYQAARLPGWRPRSRGLLEAVRRTRGI